MVKLGLLITAKHRLLSVAAILDVFETVNSFYVQSGKEAPFAITLFYPGDHNTGDTTFGRYTPHRLAEGDSEDLILIPAFSSEDLKIAIDNNIECLPWLRSQYLKGARIASFC